MSEIGGTHLDQVGGGMAVYMQSKCTGEVSSIKGKAMSRDSKLDSGLDT